MKREYNWLEKCYLYVSGFLFGGLVAGAVFLFLGVGAGIELAKRFYHRLIGSEQYAQM